MERLTFFQLYEKAYGKVFGKKPKRNPFNFEIHLIDSCNLKCKGCFHFAPLAKPDSCYPLDEFQRDIERISALFEGKFGWIHLLGGEPLLNPKINEYLDIVGANVKKGQIDLITNGTLLPKMDEGFFASCKKNHIRIAITSYPIGFDYEKAMDLVLSHDVPCYLFGDRSGQDAFCSASLMPESQSSAKKVYLSCIVSNACVTLDHGKLYHCSLPAYARLYNEAFGQTFDTESDAISIYNHSKKEILDFLRTPQKFCKYCDIPYRNEHPIPWGLSQLKKEEWLK